MDRIYPAEYAPEETGVLSFTAAVCASMQAAICVSLLCGRKTEHGRLICVDLSSMDFGEIRL